MSRAHRPVSLRQAVADRQRARSLSEQQLQALRRLPHGSANARWPGRLPLGLAAAVGALAGVLLAVWLLGAPRPDGDAVLVRIAEEVATNHLKLRPLEVRGDDLDTLRRYFTELDFRPLDTAMLDGSGRRLLGGRYCSVQGRIAAQFRVQTERQELSTVYQARYDPQVHGSLPDRGKGESPVRLVARGVAVYLWVEDGVLFAVTGVP